MGKSLRDKSSMARKCLLSSDFRHHVSNFCNRAVAVLAAAVIIGLAVKRFGDSAFSVVLSFPLVAHHAGLTEQPVDVARVKLAPKSQVRTKRQVGLRVRFVVAAVATPER